MKRPAFLALAVVALTASAAFSQVQTPAPAAPSIVDLLRPYLQDLATLAVTIVCGIVAKYVRDRWGIELQSANRAAFQTAVTNAAGLLASTGDMAQAVEYLQKSAPDAIKHFDLKTDQLPEKIQAKAGILEAAGAVIPVLPGAVEAAHLQRS